MSLGEIYFGCAVILRSAQIFEGKALAGFFPLCCEQKFKVPPGFRSATRQAK